MKPLNILYVGTASGTSLDRANAYRRLGHQVTILDLRHLLPKTSWVDRITWHLGGHLLAPLLYLPLRNHLADKQYDVCHVDGGEWVSPSVARLLKQHAHHLINYNIDDPTGPRDGPRFEAYRRALPLYDLVAVVRPINIDEVTVLGARNAVHVFRTADEVMHAPRSLTPEIHQKWDSDVLFLGTWMPERGPFLKDLIDQGINVTIRGENWHKAAEWDLLRSHWKGPAVYGDEYAHAIQCAKISIGLLSKGNRDLHTTRSLEIPALGGLLCAERTVEHLAMYIEGKEALFWSNVEECAAQCRSALENENLRKEIASEGHKRYTRNRHSNEAMLKTLLSEINYE